MAQSMALTFYSADVISHFKRVDDEIIKKMAQELSELTLRIPIQYHPDAYKKGEFIKAINSLKSLYFTATNDNRIDIRGEKELIKQEVNPLYLMALFTYCVDRLSGGQMKDHSEAFRMGSLIAQDVKT